MLMYLALLCLLACLAGLLTRAIRAPFAQTLPLVLTGISLVTYLFTGAGEKEWLPLLLLPAAAAAAFFALRRGAGPLRLGPPFFALLLAMGLTMALSGQIQLTVFDDVAHWGLFTRQISGMDQFPTAAQSASTFSDYPPGLQMLTAFLHLYTPRVTVAAMIDTQMLWYMGLTLPLLADFGWRRRWWSNLMLVGGEAAFLLVFPAFYTKYHQMSLVVEPVMTLLLGWALLTAWRSPRPGLWDLAAVSGALSLLAISKSTGILYALAGLAAVMVLWAGPLRETVRRGSLWPRLMALAAAAAVPAFWLTWQVLCRLKGTSSYFTQDVSAGAFGPANLLEFFTGGGQAGEVIPHYLQFFCFEPLNRTGGLSALGALLLFWALVLALRRLVPSQRRALTVAGAGLTVVFLAYAVMLCYSYLYLFDADEAQQLAAYHRYIAPLPIAMLYLALGALAPFAARLNTPKRRGLALACAAAAFAFGVNWTAATELVPGWFLQHRAPNVEEANWAREQTEMQPVFDSFVPEMYSRDASTLVLTEGPQWAHDCRLYKFELAPGSTLSLNPMEFGDNMAEKYAWWAAGGWPYKFVFCSWNGQTVADALALTDTTGAPLRANCLYCMEADGSLVFEKELAAPAR